MNGEYFTYFVLVFKIIEKTLYTGSEIKKIRKHKIRKNREFVLEKVIGWTSLQDFSI